MFERYTEKARRAVFFARYEATQFGALQIEAEHILLGVLREDRNLVNRVFSAPHHIHESIRSEIQKRTIQRDQISSNIDLPLSSEAKRALAFAAEESEVLQCNHIGTDHLLLGLLRAENSVAAQILNDNGAYLHQVREKVGKRETNSSQYSTLSIDLGATPSQDADERWMSEVSKACINLKLFTGDDLVREFTRVADLRYFRADVEALLRILAEKGLADPKGLSSLALELRDENRLAEFLKTLGATEGS